MSYILDALRRAQAERERGQVPGLHAQPGLGGAQPRLRPPQGGEPGLPAWAWAASGALLTVLALLGWAQMRGGKEAPASAAAAPQVLPAPSPVLSTAPVAVPGPAPVPAAGTAGAVAATPGVPAPPLVVVSAPPAPPARAVQTPPPKAAPAPDVPQAAAPVTTPPAPADAQKSALPPVLSAEQKTRWPALVLGGTVWSDTPSARFIILGGQVVREGQSTPDGVLVERITPTSAVLRWKDQRATMPF